MQFITTALGGTAARALACAVALAALPSGGWAQTRTQSICAGQSHCTEVASFAAAVTDFRTSTQGRTRIITATVRFTNKNAQALALGYIDGSGIAVDDQGNRYAVFGATSVRGIGSIANGRVDPKFVLQPGESSDARFELSWNPSGRDIFGFTFNLELSVREIIALPGNQLRLGREHAIQFRGLGQAPPAVSSAPSVATPVRTTAAAPAAGAPPAAAPQPAAPATPREDACAGKTRCYDAGPFVAEIQQITAAHVGTYRDHVIRLNVRFRNLTAEPLILGYSSGTSLMTDNYGNRYFWGRAATYDTSVTGMGVVQRNKAPADFVLNPGESRNATFQVTRYRPGNNPIGTGFTWDVAIEQLEMLSAEQIRTVRQYSLSFADITARTPAAAAPAQDLNDASKKLKDLFRKKK